MPAAITIQDSFLASAYELPKEITKKVFKALRNLAHNNHAIGQNIEKLNGKASEMWSLRVDDDYRIIFHRSGAKPAVFIFVGKHDEAYQFANHCSKIGFADLKDFLPLTASLAAVPSSSRAVKLVNMIRKSVQSSPTQVEAVAEIDYLESLIATRKYLPLSRYLLKNARSVHVAFTDLEKILGLPLPDSARNYRAWWANEVSGRHVQASAWMGIGWKVESVDLHAESVTFKKMSPS